MGWVPVLPQLRGGREVVLGLGAGVGGLTSAVRACGSSSTRLGPWKRTLALGGDLLGMWLGAGPSRSGRSQTGHVEG